MKVQRIITASRWVLPLAGSIAVFSGCSSTAEEQTETPVARAFQPLSMLTDWQDEGLIRICWHSSADPYPDERKLVEDAVMQNWGSALESPIQIDWNGCDDPDMTIVIDNDAQPNVSHTNKTFTMNFEFIGWPGGDLYACDVDGNPCPDLEIVALAIHEFGHVLAFMHEQNRPESEQPAECNADRQGADGDLSLTPWDRFSTLLYGEPTLTPPATCRPPRGNRCDDGTPCNRSSDCASGPCRGAPPVNALGLSRWDSDGLRRAYTFPRSFNPGGTEWCSHAEGSVHVGDFDGNAQQDVLCHDTLGNLWVDYADANGHYQGTDFQSEFGGWCDHAGGKLHVGNFDGDFGDDLLCHDWSGNLWIDHASSTGAFLGTDWSLAAQWCTGTNQKLLVADFNADGRDDLMCRNDNGDVQIGLADSSGEFHGTQSSTSGNAWCAHSGGVVHLGDFNGDSRADRLCHDPAGNLWVDLATTGSNIFGNTDWSEFNDWCEGPTKQVLVADYDGDGREDLLCHDKDTGRKEINFAYLNGTLFTLGSVTKSRGEWSGPFQDWCGGPNDRMLSGPIDRDAQADFLCYRKSDGRFWIQYPTPFVAVAAYSGGLEMQSQPLSSGLFELDSVTDWTCPTGCALEVETLNPSEPGRALATTAKDWNILRSRKFSGDELPQATSKLGIDVFVPEPAPNPWWFGSMQVYLTCPSLGVYNSWVDESGISGPAGQYTRVVWDLSSYHTALLNSTYDDCSIDIALNVPSTLGRYVVDNLSFQ